MSEDRDDVIILIDENGNEVEAEYIDTIEYQGNEYVVLLPRDDTENGHGDSDGDDEEEVVILKVEQDGDGDEETFVAIEDEAEQDAVFEIFTRRMEEMEYDEDEPEDDEDDDPEDAE